MCQPAYCSMGSAAMIKASLSQCASAALALLLAVSTTVPAEDVDAGFQLCSLSQGLPGVSSYTILNEEVAGLLLINRRHGILQGEALETPGCLSRPQLLNLKPVFTGTAQDALDDEPSCRPGLQEPGFIAQLFSAQLLELIPEVMRLLQKRHVIWVLKVGHPDNPGVAV